MDFHVDLIRSIKTQYSLYKRNKNAYKGPKDADESQFPRICQTNQQMQLGLAFQ